MAMAWSGLSLGRASCLPVAICACVVATRFCAVDSCCVARSKNKLVEIFMNQVPNQRMASKASNKVLAVCMTLALAW